LTAREGGIKCLKKVKKKTKKMFFFVLSKYESVTHVSTCIFKGHIKNIVFRPVASVTILDSFFHRPDFFQPCTFFNKNSFKLLFIKSNKISQYQRGRAPPNAPPSLFRVKGKRQRVAKIIM